MYEDSSKNFKISPEKMKKIVNSPEAKQLMALLQRDGGEKFRQAAAELKKGNTDAARELLRPMTETEEAEKLLKSVEL